jgi:glycosyltransferase involved in cell wall biosynthesis
MYGLGGAEIQTYYYAKEFSKQGWDVTFLSVRKPKTLNQFDNTNINIVLYNNSKLFILNWLKILWLLFEINADIYYNRHHNSILGLFALKCMVSKSKFIWSTMHDEQCSVEYLNNKLLKRYSRRSWIIRILGGVKRYFEKKLYIFGGKNADHIFVQNITQKEIIKSDFNRDSIIIYNSHPLPKENKKGSKSHVIFVSTMKEFKRPSLYADIVRKLNTLKINFIVIGENFSDESKAKKLKKVYGENHINYLGKKSIDEVNSYIASSSVLVNTSDSEGFPNTFIQAWLRGIPVVSLKIDPDDIIMKNNLGFVCGDNLNIASKKIRLLTQDEDLWNEYSHRCYRYAASNFNIQHSVKRMIRIIGDSLSKNEHIT